MSTFCGVMLEEEFRGCVIDYFQDDALKSGKAFFLSHFHQDHMKGLTDDRLHKKFKEDRELKLFCSILTKKFILKNRMIDLPEEQIVTLDRDPIHICPDQVSIRVTPLRAGHCPGSLMLLFEGGEVTSLYSGDFRMTVDDLKRCRPLHCPNQEVVLIDTLYLDTTFASEDYEYFPTRQKSRDHIVDIIHRNRETSKYFAIEITAKTGIEYLMVELYKEFKSHIHVGDSLCQSVLSCVDQLKNVVTSDIKKAFIHFCVPMRWSLKCDDCPRRSQPNETLVIKPSAQYFNKYALKLGEVITESDRQVRVAYSSHSSLREIAEFVAYLKPLRIVPSVVERGRDAEDIVTTLETYAISELGQKLTRD